jgi:molecular chaperone GrpE
VTDPKRPGAELPESESEAEESAGALPLDRELEDALREAADSVADAPASASDASEEAAEGGEPEDAAKELEVARTRLLRLQADFENFRRRAHAERRDLYQYGHENLVKDLLSTVDNLERAIGHAQENADGDLGSFLQGVELVRRELIGTLEAHSVSEVEALGKAFDPALHEAMTLLPDGSVEPNTVIDVLQKGYVLRDRLLRPARVIVAKAPEADNEDEGEAAG